MSPARSRPLAFVSPDQFSLPLFDDPAMPRAPTAAPSTAQSSAPQAGGPRARVRGLLLDGHPVSYLLERGRRRTIGFLVDERGLTIRAPRWVSVAEIDAALHEKAKWVLRKLVEWRDYQARRERLAVRWEHGAPIRYLGDVVTMHVDNGARGVALEGSVLRIGLPPGAGAEQMRDRVQSWLQSRAREHFATRIPVFAARLGRGPRRWSLSSARTRWGSCGADGTVLLNWRLMHFAPELIDYVIAHELAHLRELNHGKRFWQTVGDLLPGYEQAREQLRRAEDHGAHA